MELVDDTSQLIFFTQMIIGGQRWDFGKNKFFCGLFNSKHFTIYETNKIIEYDTENYNEKVGA